MISVFFVLKAVNKVCRKLDSISMLAKTHNGWCKYINKVSARLESLMFCSKIKAEIQSISPTTSFNHYQLPQGFLAQHFNYVTIQIPWKCHMSLQYFCPHRTHGGRARRREYDRDRMWWKVRSWRDGEAEIYTGWRWCLWDVKGQKHCAGSSVTNGWQQRFNSDSLHFRNYTLTHTQALNWWDNCKIAGLCYQITQRESSWAWRRSKTVAICKKLEINWRIAEIRLPQEWPK